MKKTITLFFLLVVTLLSAQDQYTKGMEKAFQFWGEGKTTEASNLFERIAMAEMDNWLPNYYLAQVNTVAAFTEKDKEKLAQLLGKAQEAIDIAKAISPDNVEIMVQQAMIHTAWVASDGATYGMTLSPKIVAIYNKALAMAPDNPRVVLNKAEWDMGSASYFGQDTTPYCKDIERSLELFANFKPESPFYPSWGKERAETVLANCK
ncbi:hypothetical protein GGR42_002588 [Saonia flava]|uniref:Uncharacterized protein n=1 Tax=Saonia flava TaxID=523696 RepID=A0A846QY26_9FLAO|nr:hypothetical protein [Saonia flava]NJB72097.1 hypothetical protein [Saonia flava]